MWKPVHDPGPWSQFLKRKDIIGLPLKEAKKKFLKEQLDYDNFITYQQLALKGISPKGPQAPTELVSIPAFEGLLRYADYDANTCPSPPVDIFAQNFGEDYVDSIVDTSTDERYPQWQINFNDQAGGGYSGTSIKLAFRDAILPSLTQGNVTLELIPEFQGRENVLKLTVPPRLAGSPPNLVIAITIGSNVPTKPNFSGTHTFSVAFGLWGEGFGWDNSYVSNNVAMLTGSSTLLEFLASLSPTNPSPQYGRGISWEADQWNDDRTIAKLLSVPKGENVNWVDGVNTGGGGFQRIWIRPEDLGFDPVTFYSPEYAFYLSDFNFRLCPV